ncbi:MAG: CehA/McbA family metallohydrolase [Pirellulaceae bacterium]
MPDSGSIFSRSLPLEQTLANRVQKSNLQTTTAFRRSAFLSVVFFSLTICLVSTTIATELIQLTPDNYDQLAPRGKEVDAIYGDWVLRNEHVTAVIAQTTPGRKANMTTRGVAGMVIDFTNRFHGSDQLSCFYPTAGRYFFESAQRQIWVSKNNVESLLAEGSNIKADELTVVVKGTPVSKDGTQATVRYTLREDQHFLEYKVEIRSEADTGVKVTTEDSLRCDGNLFKFSQFAGGFVAEDRYFGQGYYFKRNGAEIVRTGSGRKIILAPEQPSETSATQTQPVQWSGHVYCGQGLAAIKGLLSAEAKETYALDAFLLLRSKAPRRPIAHAKVEYFSAAESDRKESLGVLQTTPDGFVRIKLPPGDYVAKIEALGHEPTEHAFSLRDRQRSETLTLDPPSRIRAKIVDGKGRPIAAKAQFIGLDGTPTPDFGPDSAIYAVKNAVYCANGTFEQSITPGRYEVILSHGPEYDAETLRVQVSPGQLVPIDCTLERVVDTAGWVSTEFHSHSSPSGDNVSHQTGRVLNLLAEHIEFAPCTEHNRIDTYADDLELLKATTAMATCTGMELTGGPLPINHQNAFPLERHVHEQDGGGPQTDADPVKQIERLALWDDNAPKVVQSNHPNIPSILGDRDLDGEPDQGFRGMLGWMDVIEVHPPEKIFETPAEDVAPNDRRNPVFYWMQLLNVGYRITGVVNTDAHYNFHGSGWLRNYLESSTDDPSQISIDQMIHSSEHGHVVMTTGPYLEFELRRQTIRGVQRFEVGEDFSLNSDPTKLWIRVQCPNWFDINRVQVFANGRPRSDLNFTRKTHPGLFSNDVVRFEAEWKLPEFEEDTHVIVAAIGEGLKLGPVMGPERGELPPVAVTNPIFVDVDGGGFRVNGDDLGVPLMIDKSALSGE